MSDSHANQSTANAGSFALRPRLPVAFASVNVETDDGLSSRLGVSSMPAMVLIKRNATETDWRMMRLRAYLSTNRTMAAFSGWLEKALSTSLSHIPDMDGVETFIADEMLSAVAFASHDSVSSDADGWVSAVEAFMDNHPELNVGLCEQEKACVSPTIPAAHPTPKSPVWAERANPTHWSRPVRLGTISRS